MDFHPTEEQAAAAGLAAQIFADLATHDRLGAAARAATPNSGRPSPPPG